MEIITNIPEDIMLVRTHQEVIEFRGSLFNAARQWWYSNSQKKVKQADYVMVDVDGIVREVYKPDKKTWHLERDSGKDILTFEGERWVFGIKNDSDDGEYCKIMIAPESIRSKYVGKILCDSYRWGKNRQNPVRFSF